jgi:hypothetical protein
VHDAGTDEMLEPIRGSILATAKRVSRWRILGVFRYCGQELLYRSYESFLELIVSLRDDKRRWLRGYHGVVYKLGQ